MRDQIFQKNSGCDVSTGDCTSHVCTNVAFLSKNRHLAVIAYTWHHPQTQAIGCSLGLIGRYSELSESTLDLNIRDRTGLSDRL